MRKPMVAGNWKMNASQAGTVELMQGIKAGLSEVANAEVVICPPYPYLHLVAALAGGTDIRFGGQNCNDQVSGAFTGAVAAGMLVDLGCTYVILGHSERRALFDESDDLAARKFAAARKVGLKPIFCVGETLEQREAGQTEEVVGRQLQAVIELEGVEALKDAVVAYEPVWAIGTGKTASPEQAQEVHAFLRGMVAKESAEVAEGLQILYGGSVKPDNAALLFSQPDIDGGLIGGASLKADDFLAICRAA